MRVLILSDIHSNLEALEAALQQTEFDLLWVLGDLVGYGANPNEVVEKIRQLEPALIVRGNHDKVCCGLEEPGSFSDMAREAVLWTRGQLSDESSDYLRSLPQGPKAAGEWAICHGSPQDEDEYLVSEEQVWNQMSSVSERACFFGHTHVPLMCRQCGEERQIFCVDDSVEVQLDPECRFFINPGSIGQPRDGDRRASMAVLDPDTSELSFIKFDYPVERAAQRIIEAGLPELLAQRLFIGR